VMWTPASVTPSVWTSRPRTSSRFPLTALAGLLRTCTCCGARSLRTKHSRSRPQLSGSEYAAARLARYTLIPLMSWVVVLRSHLHSLAGRLGSTSLCLGCSRSKPHARQTRAPSRRKLGRWAGPPLLSTCTHPARWLFVDQTRQQRLAGLCRCSQAVCKLQPLLLGLVHSFPGTHFTLRSADVQQTLQRTHLQGPTVGAHRGPVHISGCFGTATSVPIAQALVVNGWPAMSTPAHTYISQIHSSIPAVVQAHKAACISKRSVGPSFTLCLTLPADDVARTGTALCPSVQFELSQHVEAVLASVVHQAWHQLLSASALRMLQSRMPGHVAVSVQQEGPLQRSQMLQMGRPREVSGRSSHGHMVPACAGEDQMRHQAMRRASALFSKRFLTSVADEGCLRGMPHGDAASKGVHMPSVDQRRHAVLQRRSAPASKRNISHADAPSLEATPLTRRKRTSAPASLQRFDSPSIGSVDHASELGLSSRHSPGMAAANTTYSCALLLCGMTHHPSNPPPWPLSHSSDICHPHLRLCRHLVLLTSPDSLLQIAFDTPVIDGQQMPESPQLPQAWQGTATASRGVSSAGWCHSSFEGAAGSPAMLCEASQDAGGPALISTPVSCTLRAVSSSPACLSLCSSPLWSTPELLRRSSRLQPPFTVSAHKPDSMSPLHVDSSPSKSHSFIGPSGSTSAGHGAVATAVLASGRW
jgi:hypothetical protein